MNDLDLRPSPLAGTWYEADAARLTREVDEFVTRAQIPPLDGEVIGVIAPHAGHRYSGAVAGCAFAAARHLEPDIVVIVAPFHNFEAHALLTTKHQAYSTPLGSVRVDHDVLTQLAARLDVPITAVANDKEHSLEIELPFLQRIFPQGFRLLPIMIRAQEPHIARALGAALAMILADTNFLLVASTDLSHFYNQSTAERLDQEMLRRFESLVPESIFEAEDTGKGFACGHAAVAAILWAARALGANRVRVLKHATSGDVSGDYSSVVGYGAAAILRAP